MLAPRISADGGLVSARGGLIVPGGGLVVSSVEIAALLRAVAVAGLDTPAVAVDFSLAASGSFANLGLDAGTLDPEGTPSYAQAFPAPIGGTGVSFPAITADRFVASSNAVGNPTAGQSLAVFSTFASASNPAALANLVTQRNDSADAGWEIRVDTSGRPVCLVEDDGDTAPALTLASDHCNGGANYVGFSADLDDGNMYACSNLDAESSASLAGVDNMNTATNVLTVGDSARQAIHAGAVMRCLLIWRGPSAEGIREANWDALYVALGGTL